MENTRFGGGDFFSRQTGRVLETSLGTIQGGLDGTFIDGVLADGCVC